MSDPLGLISGASGAAGGPARALGARSLHALGRGGSVDATGGGDASPDFKSVLMDELREVNRLQQEASEAIEDLATGARTDFDSVLMATKKADLAFEMLLGVRNKVLDAYNEIKQVRV